MKELEKLQHLTVLVAQTLKENVWDNPDGTSLPSKSFQMVIDEKSVLIKMYEDKFNFVITGDYQSEGRNQLDIHSMMIPKGSSDIEINRLVTHFSSRVDEVVAQSFCRRAEPGE